MTRLALLSLLVLLTAAPPALAAPNPPPLYREVTGGEEYLEVPGKTTLGLLAAAKGVKWTVVAKQNCLDKPYKITKGMVLKFNTTHIVPAELDHGFVINLPELLLYRFVNGTYQRRYSLAVGKPSWPTPTGTYKIVEKRKNPTWNVPPSIQEEMDEQGLEVCEKVPPGPQNPLGKFWMGTSASGVGIHATNRPWSVGYYVSHGCIRMLPDEISALFPQVEVGTPVKIIYRPVKLALTPEGRIYLEAHPDIYQKKIKAMEYLKDLAEIYRLTDRIDWDKVPPILKAREGIAQEITKGPPEPGPPPAPAPGDPSSCREVRLSPLQDKKAAVE
jgi:L,D-transpeptidase ErfK/SrfK